MNPHRLANGTLAFWKKVGIVCGGALAALSLLIFVWKGASFGAAMGWNYANRSNNMALSKIVDRLDAMQVRDSLTQARLTRLEATQRRR